MDNDKLNELSQTIKSSLATPIVMNNYSDVISYIQPTTLSDVYNAVNRVLSSERGTFESRFIPVIDKNIMTCDLKVLCKRTYSFSPSDADQCLINNMRMLLTDERIGRTSTQAEHVIATICHIAEQLFNHNETVYLTYACSQLQMKIEKTVPGMSRNTFDSFIDTIDQITNNRQQRKRVTAFKIVIYVAAIAILAALCKLIELTCAKYVQYDKVKKMKKMSARSLGVVKHDEEPVNELEKANAERRVSEQGVVSQMITDM